ncbi:MAG: P-II family nitrogen regulator [Clostridiales Family XIII bacterium]|jgi:nitrogen regulatory protein PII|nr:P-II family nitrogen regulator [Clostridiales Family XIII bacterium]
MSDKAKNEFTLILTVVNRGFADTVINAAREAGARGSTIFYARGTGVHEVEKFFAVSIQPEKEVLLTLVRKEETRNVMESIVKTAGLKTEGKGLAIALPVSNVAGISVYDEACQREGAESK